MNTQQIQFKRQGVVSLLFAGLTLALAAGLAWAGGADASGSTFSGHESRSLSWSQPRWVEGSKLGSGTDGISFAGCDSELLPGYGLVNVKMMCRGTALRLPLPPQKEKVCNACRNEKETTLS